MEVQMKCGRILRVCTLAGFGVAAMAFGSLAAMAEDSAAELAAIRAAAEKYLDINVALADGYIDPENMCVTAEMMGLPAEAGAMGMHFVRPDILKITSPHPRVNGDGTHTDFTQPAVLIYEPQEDGSMELVAVENLVFQKAWHDAGNAEPPVFQGRKWDLMADDPATPIDEAHGFEPHYDQHVWVFRDNPEGALQPFNPAVTCAHHKGGGHQQH
jgi:hypothetical protein